MTVSACLLDYSLSVRMEKINKSKCQEAKQHDKSQKVKWKGVLAKYSRNLAYFLRPTLSYLKQTIMFFLALPTFQSEPEPVTCDTMVYLSSTNSVQEFRERKGKWIWQIGLFIKYGVLPLIYNILTSRTGTDTKFEDKVRTVYEHSFEFFFLFTANNCQYDDIYLRK